MVAAFEKLGQFYNVCRKFRERPVNFTLGKLLFTIDKYRIMNLYWTKLIE